MMLHFILKVRKSGKGMEQGRKKQHTKVVLEKAVLEVRRGASLRKVAAAYKIPHTTLQDYKTKKYAHDPHPNLAITPKEEEALVGYILWMAEHAFPISRPVVKLLATKIVRDSVRATLVNIEKGVSDNWWASFTTSP